MRTELTTYDKNGKKKLNKPEADVQVYFKPPDYSRTDLRDSYVIYKGFFGTLELEEKIKKSFKVNRIYFSNFLLGTGFLACYSNCILFFFYVNITKARAQTISVAAKL